MKFPYLIINSVLYCKNIRDKVFLRFGIQKSTWDYVALLDQYHVGINMVVKGKPEENGLCIQIPHTTKVGFFKNTEQDFIVTLF